MKKEGRKTRNGKLDLALEIFGWYGTVAIVGAYALSSFKILSVDTWAYQALNLTGALGLVAISAYKRTYQPAVLNGIWSAIAIVALLGLVWR